MIKTLTDGIDTIQVVHVDADNEAECEFCRAYAVSGWLGVDGDGLFICDDCTNKSDWQVA
jgi:hypothetical protein